MERYLNEHKPYNKYPVTKSGLGVTYYLSKSVLSLPMHPYLKEDGVNYICEKINNFIKNLAISRKGNTLLLFQYVFYHKHPLS